MCRAVRAHGDDGDLPQSGFRYVVERGFVFDSVHLPLSLLDKLGGFDLCPYRELPVRARLALRDDCLGELARRDDFAGHCEMPVGDLRPDEPDAPQRVVFVVRQKRHGFGDRHPRQVHDHGVRPSKEAHLAARIGESRDGVLAARTLCCGYF